MNNYFYVVSGVIIILALFESLIPNSSVGKSVKTILSVICVMIILSPVINIIKGDNNATQVGTEFNEYLLDYQNELTEFSVKSLLQTNGFSVENITVKGDYANGNYLVNKIDIKFKDLVINDETEHINIIEKIKNLLSSRLNILRAEIVIEYW